MEGGGVLLGVQEYEAQVEGDNPLEGIEIEGSFEAGDCCYILLLAEETHSNVVP